MSEDRPLIKHRLTRLSLQRLVEGRARHEKCTPRRRSSGTPRSRSSSSKQRDLDFGDSEVASHSDSDTVTDAASEDQSDLADRTKPTISESAKLERHLGDCDIHSEGTAPRHSEHSVTPKAEEEEASISGEVEVKRQIISCDKTGSRSHTGPSHKGPSHTGQSHTGQSHKGPSHTGASHTGPSHKKPSHKGPSHTGQSQTGSSHTGQSHKGPSHTEASHTGPSHKGPSHTGPSHTQSAPPATASPSLTSAAFPSGETSQSGAFKVEADPTTAVGASRLSATSQDDDRLRDLSGDPSPRNSSTAPVPSTPLSSRVRAPREDHAEQHSIHSPPASPEGDCSLHPLYERYLTDELVDFLEDISSESEEDETDNAIQSQTLPQFDRPSSRTQKSAVEEETLLPLVTSTPLPSAFKEGPPRTPLIVTPVSRRPRDNTSSGDEAQLKETKPSGLMQQEASRKPVPAPAAVPKTPGQPPAPLGAQYTPETAEQQAVQVVRPHGYSTRSQGPPHMELQGHHRQVASSKIDEATLDQCFQVVPKFHYIKNNQEDTGKWLESASFEAILLELLCFALDHGQSQQRELEGQFEKELGKAVEGIEKLECFEAFCTTFLKDGTFKPTGRVNATSSSGKEEKHGRLFRMINADLQNLQRQHRILSMVCTGTADHEVHTEAQRENLRKLVEDLVQVVHPGDRGTFSEVYKTIAESASYDQRMVRPQLSSLKVVSHPDIVMPFGGPIVAGGSVIKCDSLEQKIRAKLPSLLIQMHFSERRSDDKMNLGRSRFDDSGIEASLMDTTDAGSRSKSQDRGGSGSGGKAAASTGAAAASTASSRSSKRRQDDPPATPPSRPKRHREELHSHGIYSHGDGGSKTGGVGSSTASPSGGAGTGAGTGADPPHVIHEVYTSHLSQLITALSQTPLGYIKHSKYGVSTADPRDGTASVTCLGMIVSGDDIYLTKVDASHDYLDSLVETFRMDNLQFMCMGNALSLYRGTHVKALLMFLRYVCLNFPKTTYFLSD